MLISIQWLRAIAALAVVIHHIGYEIATRHPGILSVADVAVGAAGVDLFFVISGFIMVHVSAGLFGREGVLAPFLIRRFIRIVPLYWALTTLSVAVQWLMPSGTQPADPLAHIVASFLFIPSVRWDGVIHPVFGLGWTLNYEMMFYLLFGLCLVLPILRGVFLVVAILLSLVLLGALGVTGSPQIIFWTSPIILTFAFGVLLALGYARGLRLGTGLCVALVAAGVVLLGAYGHGFPETPWQRLAHWGLPSALIFAGVVLGPSPASGWLSGPLAKLGDASYSLYLTHPLTLRLAKMAWPWGEQPATSTLIAWSLAAFLASIVVALLCFQFFERPVTAWLRARFEPGLRQHAPPVPT